ncbi:MAG: 7TM-DISM domain-containing protein [Polynucleobacter sp.]|nr:7TM-DISM domain-containing protein [Polynucleobacter sp.]
MRAPVRTLLFLFALFSGSAIANGNYILQQAYYEDKANALTIDQVKNEPFTPYDGWLAKGYSQSTFWIKLTIKPSDSELMTRIRPAYAENIEVYDGISKTPFAVVGAQHSWMESELPTYSHNFKLSPSLHEQDIYLKVKQPRSYLLDFDALPVAAYLTVDHRDSLISMGYIVFTLAMALGLLAIWLTNRERVLGFFVLQQFVAFLHTILVVGYARIFFDRHIDISIIQYLSYVVVVTYPLIGVWANKLLIKEYGLKPYYSYAFNALIGASSIVICLLLLGNINQALKLNAQVVMLAMTLFWLASWFGTTNNQKHRDVNLPINALRAYYALNLVMWAISVLPLLGMIQAKEFTVHSYLLYNLLSGLFFFLLLQYRAKLILKNELTKAATLKKEIDNERYLREEQGKLMAMLTHEIRTPLSVLKLVVDRKVSGSDLEDFANRAVSNIDSIIDKCIQLDQLDLKALEIAYSRFDLLVLVQSIAVDSVGGERIRVYGQPKLVIESDFDITKTIVSNLIANAVRYSIPNTDIAIHIEACHARAENEQNAGIKIAVQNAIADTDMPVLSQVFDKYYRGPSSTKVSGSGLGLFFVKELAHALRGNVQCSVDTNSITFTVWIPT